MWSTHSRRMDPISRECLDHIVAFGEPHLLRILRSYARYYNDVRTHRSLDKDSPIARPVQRTGRHCFLSWADSITATHGFRFSVPTLVLHRQPFTLNALVVDLQSSPARPASLCLFPRLSRERATNRFSGSHALYCRRARSTFNLRAFALLKPQPAGLRASAR
jgi:hypothetical protein